MKWLKDKDRWELSNTFNISGNMKGNPPIVGNIVYDFTIIGIWINNRGFLKAYQCLCDCGDIIDYINPDALRKHRIKSLTV